MKNYFFIIAAITILSIIPLSFAESGKYDLKIDENTFNLPYSFDGKLISMDIDKESKSLLIGTTDVVESTFELSFPAELLSAENDEFVILLDGIETDYTVTHEDGMTKLSLVIPIATEEIEIIGSDVIPEFPFGALAIMGVVSIMAIMLSRSKTMQFR
ncbi:MAG: hypothetical protein EPO62_04705 [Candidatus Nitrosotenuis sp.]|nr:MAG: hypothetical protein EPO62_04705 [Candidatus Nitrosotenuis sp.]